ncbi:sigma-70 family RNA polymerase sigma factor [Kribbella sp. NPDC004536]|uniref:sigma-70 family RNA polymerase sigma factor n=1 Tax=Kribbella sp. NPDC004536 TaxID=3364106 RepID=UPI00369BF508
MSTDLSGLPDAELIARVRDAEVAAFAVLFERHRVAAAAFARGLSPDADGEDLVAEGFVLVFGQLRRGAGPDTVLRPYLMTTIRNLHIRRSRQDRKLVLTDSEETLDAPVESTDAAVDAFDRASAVAALRSLPERWQRVLWLVDVEQRTVSEIAPEFGLSANAVSALAIRAREGLRQAYLRQHVALVVCRSIADDLPSYVRGTASQRAVARIEAHLPTCENCEAAYRELVEVNSRLGVLLLPALVVAGYAAQLPGAIPVPLIGRALHALKSNLAGVKVAVAVVGLSGIAVAVVLAALVSPSGGYRDRTEALIPSLPVTHPTAPPSTPRDPTPSGQPTPTPTPSSVRPTVSVAATPRRPSTVRPATTASPSPTERPSPAKPPSTIERPRPAPAVSASLTQRGTSQNFDARVAVRTAPGVSAVRVVLLLPTGTTPAAGRDRQCRTSGARLTCDLPAGAQGTTFVEVELSYPRQPRASFDGTAEALAGTQVVSTRQFAATCTVRLPAASHGKTEQAAKRRPPG